MDIFSDSCSFPSVYGDHLSTTILKSSIFHISPQHFSSSKWILNPNHFVVYPLLPYFVTIMRILST